jgi:hypothetical protein
LCVDFLLVDFLDDDFLVVLDAVEVLAAGAEAAVAVAEGAARAPRLKADATTATMRVFKEFSREESGRADCSASQRGPGDHG